MFTVFQGETGAEVWLKAADYLVESESDVQDSRNGPTKEVLHAVFAIHDPTQRWVLNRRPAMNPAFAIAEVIWILSGRHDSAFLNYWNPVLPKFQGEGPQYHGAYGYRLRRSFGVDQISRAYHALSANPDSRQVVLQIWSARLDLPSSNGSPVDKDIPCNLMSLLKVRNKRLEWMQIMRSNDLVRGVPHNFVQFTTLQEVMAGWLGVAVGSYHQISDSLHVYSKDLVDEVRERELVVEQNTDSLLLPRSKSLDAVEHLGTALERMADDSISELELRSIAHPTRLPTAYANMLLVCGADAARRRAWHTVSEDLVRDCTNPVLCQAWERWHDRKEQLGCIG